MVMMSFNAFITPDYAVGLYPNSAMFNNVFCGKEMNKKPSAYVQSNPIQQQWEKQYSQSMFWKRNSMLVTDLFQENHQ